MSGEVIRNLVLKPLRAAEPGEGLTALEIDYGSLEDYFTRASNQYAEAREDYLNSCIEDVDLPRKSKTWQQTGRRLARWAETWFMVYSGDKEKQELALDVLDRIDRKSVV